jgi:hypothetical protein
MESPLTFTMALWAKVDQDQSDRPVTAAMLARAVPFTRSTEIPLPPAFFRVLHRIDDARTRQVAS